MASSRLEELPLEILQLIAACLTNTDHKAASAFSRCSSTCHQGASHVLYSTIRLRISILDSYHRERDPNAFFGDRQKFNDEVSRWNGILGRHDAYHHARRIEINEHVTVIREFPKWLQPDRPDPTHFDLLDHGDDFLDTVPASLSTPKLLKDATYPSDEEERAMWQLLLDLMGRLPSLSDIYFNHSRPNFSDVAQRLRQRQCSIRVHLPSLWIPGYLTKPDLQLPGLQLLLSLRIESITVRSCGYTYYAHTDFTHEGILDIVNNKGSRVKHLSLLSDAEDTVEWMARAWLHGFQRDKWLGFSGLHSLAPTDSTPLTSFELGGTGPTVPELLMNAFQPCNMTRLTVLKLRLLPAHKGLSWLASNIVLPSLKILILGVNTTFQQGEECGDQDLAGRFLDALLPLRELRFVNDVSPETLDITLRRHGQSLRRLWFAPPNLDSPVLFDADRVTSLRQSCPALEDLWLPVPRSQGDEKEVAMYRTLGRFPRLRTLSLALDCEDPSAYSCPEDSDLTPTEDSNLTPIYSDFDDFDNQFAKSWMVQSNRQPRNGHLRQTILNAALDEKLARQIFDTIASTKPTGDTNLLLERLELRPCRGIYTAGSKDVVEVVGNWWLLERAPVLFPVDRNLIRATKIRCPGDVYDEICDKLVPLEKEVEPIVRRIWPNISEEDEEWSKKWESLPLAIVRN